MSRVVYRAAASVDGFIAGPGHEMDWLNAFEGDDGDFGTFLAGVGALVMGSNTFQWLQENHLRCGTADAQPWPYTVPSWIATRRQWPLLPEGDLRLAQGDVREIHREMLQAAQGRDLWVVGGGELAGQFLDRGLLDEIVVDVAPVTLGAGYPLLPRRLCGSALRCVDSQLWGPGFVRIRYQIVQEDGTRRRG